MAVWLFIAAPTSIELVHSTIKIQSCLPSWFGEFQMISDSFVDLPWLFVLAVLVSVEGSGGFSWYRVGLGKDVAGAADVAALPVR